MNVVFIHGMVIAFYRDGRIMVRHARALPLLKRQQDRDEKRKHDAKPQQELHPIDTSCTHNFEDQFKPVRLSTTLFTPSAVASSQEPRHPLALLPILVSFQ